MRICYVFQDEYPWDIRVEKFAGSLRAAGHRVVILSRNRRGLPSRSSIAPGIDVVRLPAGLTAVDRTVMNTPAFFSPWWLAALTRTVKRHATDLILVRDLPLALTAVCVGRLTGRPVWMDMAENYPAMIQDSWDFYGPKPADYLIRNPAFLRRLERVVLPRLQGIFTVSEPSAERVRALTAGRVPVHIVGNTPRLDVVDQPVASPLADRLTGHSGLVLSYVGNMDAKRGLDVVVRALPALRRLDPDVLVVIVGRGLMEARLRAMAAELGVADHLLMPGWVDQREVPAIIAASDIGLIPHLVTEHTDTTIPNKIFDYMAQAKPVVVTHCRTLQNIVNVAACGRVYVDRDAEALTAAVKSLIDPATRARLGNAGRAAVEKRFRWDQDAAVLLAALEAQQPRSIPMAAAGALG